MKLGLVALLSGVVLHLVLGGWMLARQIVRRRRTTVQTMLVDLPRTPAAELGRGVDLFAGLGELLNPAGQLQGRDDHVVFALVNGMADQRVRLAVRTPTQQAAQLARTDALRNLLHGEAPGTTTRPATDDVATMLAQHQDSDGPRLAGYADYILARSPSYPLKDLAMFVGGDPLGPLATALTRQEGVTYAAYELILRALPPHDDWRAPLRDQIGQIQGTVNPEDLAAYEALVRKVEHHGFDVVVRCLVAAQTRAAAVRQVRAMHHALQTFSRPAGDARQRLRRVGSRLPGRTPGFQLIPLTPATIGTAPLPPWGGLTLIGALIGTLGGAAGGLALAQALPHLAIPLPVAPLTLPSCVLAPVLTSLSALAGTCSVCLRAAPVDAPHGAATAWRRCGRTPRPRSGRAHAGRSSRHRARSAASLAPTNWPPSGTRRRSTWRRCSPGAAVSTCPRPSPLSSVPPRPPPPRRARCNPARRRPPRWGAPGWASPTPSSVMARSP